MRTRTMLFTAVLAFVAGSAAAQSVTYDFDSATNFSGLKTYAWVRGTPGTDELNHKRIVAAVDSQLAAKGYTRVDSAASPDVFVAYHASFNKNLEINGFSSGWAGYRFSPHRVGYARVDQILIGTLVVDLVDAKTRTIVWRGAATKEIDTKASPEKRERNIYKAVEKLFRNYPPKELSGK